MSGKNQISAPSGNTGLKCQNSSTPFLGSALVSIDWLTITMSLPSLAELHKVTDFVASFLSDKFDWYPDRPIRRGKNWSATGRSVHGIQVAYNLGARVDALISIPSSAICRADGRDVWRMCRGLSHQWSARCSRLDIALDDYEKSIPYETVAQAVESGNYARATKAQLLPGECKRGEKLPTEKRGWTIYFGSRQSDKFVRYYNKSVQSCGAIDCYRWEVEFKGVRAREVWESYVECAPPMFQDTMPYVLAAYVIGGIEFVDRSSGSRLSRQETLGWWSEFKAKICSGVRTSSKRCKPSLEKKIQWLVRSVGTTLAVIEDCIGENGFESLIKLCKDSGRKRYSREHLTLIELVRLERSGAGCPV